MPNENYTSPPTDTSLAATPQAYRDGKVIEAGRQADAAGQCNLDDVNTCQIFFDPSQEALDSRTIKIGIVFMEEEL